MTYSTKGLESIERLMELAEESLYQIRDSLRDLASQGNTDNNNFQYLLNRAGDLEDKLSGLRQQRADIISRSQYRT
jgi:septation ring formation regulator EzrA